MDLQPEPDALGRIVGESRAIAEVKRLVTRVAGTTYNVLILGETGTGKELVARAIHQVSFRREGPFQALNCAAIPDTLIESELFGYEKGAFTGATRRKSGRFQLADGGTLFLDEIAELSAATQAKLLRALQELEVEPVGGTRAIPVNVRIIAATNKDLSEGVKDKRFREDLYYRLNVLDILLPPLRDRREDIALLVGYFLKQASVKLNRRFESVTEEALRLLAAYDWPGNVRQLENVVQKAAVLADGPVIGASHLPKGIVPSAPSSVTLGAVSPSLRDGKRDFEEKQILEKLRHTHGNLTEAARLLGVPRKTLEGRIHSLGLKSALDDIRHAGTSVGASEAVPDAPGKRVHPRADSVLTTTRDDLAQGSDLTPLEKVYPYRIALPAARDDELKHLQGVYVKLHFRGESSRWADPIGIPSELADGPEARPKELPRNFTALNNRHEMMTDCEWPDWAIIMPNFGAVEACWRASQYVEVRRGGRIPSAWRRVKEFEVERFVERYRGQRLLARVWSILPKQRISTREVVPLRLVLREYDEHLIRCTLSWEALERALSVEKRVAKNRLLAEWSEEQLKCFVKDHVVDGGLLDSLMRRTNQGGRPGFDYTPDEVYTMLRGLLDANKDNLEEFSVE